MQRFIAIEGKGGSGKTHLADLLEEKLSAQVFHLDDYGNDYEPFVGIPKLIEELRNVDEPLVVYEGVGVFKDDFNEFEPFRILVNIPDEVRKVRAESRDIPTDERSEDEWGKIYDIWLKAESEYFTDEIEKKADLIVGIEYEVEKIIDELKVENAQKHHSDID